MHASISSIASLLRASVLAFLMMGVVIKPMLAPLCEIHALGHLLRTYDHSPGRSALDNFELQLDRHSVPDDGHRQMHEGDSGSAYADNNASIEVAVFTFERLGDTAPFVSPLPPQRTDVPFRPPLT